ncbi:MAG TPA: hypothetical protein VFB98_01540 [Candidatus Deferrimicrobium sp.]|nr:hypothetical protein [Candidatus Deferrimicrobium sp.]
MMDEYAEVIVVAGQAEAERIVQALGAAGMTAFFRATTGLEGMFQVMAVQSRLDEARDVASMFQGCECQQEGSRDEPEAHSQAEKRVRRRGIVE